MIDSIIPAARQSWRESLEMSRRKRTLIAIIVIELLLAGGWIWLHGMAMASPHSAKDSARVIGEVFGGAMGLVMALSPLLYLMARNNDRRAASAKQSGQGRAQGTGERSMT
jgi:hypothetical protein